MRQAQYLAVALLLLLAVGVKTVKGDCQDNETDGRSSCSTSSPPVSKDCPVSGIDLAKDKPQEPFELFKDFDIGHLITGKKWFDILAIRRRLLRPTLSFYVDKVARKRWLPTQGYEIPHVYALQYASEVPGETLEEKADAIYQKIPTKADYCAKPTHMYLSTGIWLVRHDENTNTTRFSNKARQLGEEAETFDDYTVARSLAESLDRPPKATGSWALKNVNAGYVIEGRWTAHDNDDAPPHELFIFVIWGRVWVAEWCSVQGQNQGAFGFIRRDGTFLRRHPLYDEKLPDWMNWSAVVELAEKLGANKDMFRLDVFLGVPSQARSFRDGATIEERLEHMEIVVSEAEIFPGNRFDGHEYLQEEGARLWIEGYKTGNYRVVPNTEIPEEFKRTGKLSEDAEQWNI